MKELRRHKFKTPAKVVITDEQGKVLLETTLHPRKLWIHPQRSARTEQVWHECHIHLERKRLARMKWPPEKWVYPGVMVKSLHGLRVSIAGGRVKGWIAKSNCEWSNDYRINIHPTREQCNDFIASHERSERSAIPVAI